MKKQPEAGVSKACRRTKQGAKFLEARLIKRNMKKQTILDQVRVASPCLARWEDMAGDDRTRFCRQCSKNVFNFSAMTRVEVETMIREKEGRLCGRFYQRPDGRMLTADCPTGARRRRNRLARFGAAIFAAMMFLVNGCTTRRTPPVMGKIAPLPTNSKMGKTVLMGDVMYVPTPLETKQK